MIFMKARKTTYVCLTLRPSNAAHTHHPPLLTVKAFCFKKGRLDLQSLYRIIQMVVDFGKCHIWIWSQVFNRKHSLEQKFKEEEV